MSGEDVAGTLIGIVALLLILGYFAFILFVYWRIFSRMGYPGALSLLTLLPLVNVVLMIVIGFSTWPILKEAERLREEKVQLRRDTDALQRRVDELPHTLST